MGPMANKRFKRTTGNARVKKPLKPSFLLATVSQGPLQLHSVPFIDERAPHYFINARPEV